MCRASRPLTSQAVLGAARAGCRPGGALSAVLSASSCFLTEPAGCHSRGWLQIIHAQPPDGRSRQAGLQQALSQQVGNQPVSSLTEGGACETTHCMQLVCQSFTWVAAHTAHVPVGGAAGVFLASTRHGMEVVVPVALHGCCCLAWCALGQLQHKRGSKCCRLPCFSWPAAECETQHCMTVASNVIGDCLWGCLHRSVCEVESMSGLSCVALNGMSLLQL